MRKLGVLAPLVAAVLALAPSAAATTFAGPVAAPPASALIGMNGGGPLLGLPDAQLLADLDAMRNAGAGWVRLDVDWSSIEPTRGNQNWTNTDRVVNAARTKGLQVVGIAAYTPRWAQDPSVAPGTSHGRPASSAQFGAFAGQAAAHFAGRINIWEVWNEPNLSSFFSPRVDPAFYTSMLQSSAAAIRAAAPGAWVVGGALAPGVDSSDGSSASPLTFLQQMYAHGAKDAMDAVSIHPYSFPALPSNSSTASWNTFYRLRNAHDIMVNNGDGAKKIWLTEFGTPTGPGGDAVSEQQQAAIIADGLTTARSFDYLGPLFVYEIRDGATGTANIEDNFGLLHTDRSAKPAYAVVAQQAAMDASTQAPVVTTPPPPPTPTAPISLFDLLWTWLLALFGLSPH